MIHTINTTEKNNTTTYYTALINPYELIQNEVRNHSENYRYWNFTPRENSHHETRLPLDGEEEQMMICQLTANSKSLLPNPPLIKQI